jgi:hypothetical protein
VIASSRKAKGRPKLASCLVGDGGICALSYEMAPKIKRRAISSETASTQFPVSAAKGCLEERCLGKSGTESKLIRDFAEPPVSGPDRDRLVEESGRYQVKVGDADSSPV